MGEMDVDGETEVAGAPRERCQMPPPEEDPHLPPESFQVPIGGDGIDWTDLNAVFDRDDSTKGSTNPKSANANPKSRSISERSSASLKANPAVLGLPSAIGTPGFTGRASRRQRPPSGRIFPKKGARSGRESAADPGSPKVSCFGKVLSDRERRKQGRSWRWASCFEAMCRLGDERRRGSPPSAANAGGAFLPVEAGLGAMRRFASGRRSATWGEEEAEEGQMRHRHLKRAVAEVEHNGSGVE
ncbi:uncharacterized protein LOC135675023 [Musa acuminata AAA Group]|uniref:uncharacterized protein LOC135675023 n=1 Tax=Musa acuminata AAA Group TaxID=214697 RepID=UPI0031CF472E